MKASPPSPFMCGLTTPSTVAIVIAASIALPPRFNTSAPAAEASGWSDTTAAVGPPTSGRRVLCASSALGIKMSAKAVMSRFDIQSLHRSDTFGYIIVWGVHERRHGEYLQILDRARLQQCRQL